MCVCVMRLFSCVDVPVCTAQAVRFDDPSLVLSDPADTLESHMVVFAAEAARREER